MICNKCGIDKPPTEYYADPKRKSGKQTICKECIKAAVKKRSAKRREEIREYHKRNYPLWRDKKIAQDREYRAKVQGLKTPCVKCGDKRLYVIDFHHIDPSEKSFNINRKSCKSDFSVLENEVGKCICLCRNCHAEFHHLYGQKPERPAMALEEYLGRKVGL